MAIRSNPFSREESIDMSNPDVLVCGSVAFDTITVFDGYFKDHILPEHIQFLSVSFLVPTIRKEYGGCAGNISYGLQLLGGNPIPVASVGQDAQDYLQRLRNLGIDTRRIRVLPEQFTPQCSITTDLDGNQITWFHPGAMQDGAANDISDETDAIWGIVAPESRDAMFAHARRLHANGIPFVFDLGQAMPLFSGEDLQAMLKLANIVTANEYEANVIAQRTGRALQDLAQSLQALVVTQGAQGATLYEQGKTVVIEPVAAQQTLDPTGCGDAHRAGLLYGLTCGWNLADSCRLANLMGSLKIAHKGPQNYRPERTDIAALLHKHYGLDLDRRPASV